MIRWTRNERGPGRRPLLLSVGLHAVLLIGAWLGDRASDDDLEYVTYQIQLITEAELDELESPPIVETPNLPPPTPEPEPEPEPEIPDPELEPEPEPEPEEPEPEPEPEEPEPEPEPPQPAVEDRPAATPAASAADMAVRMEGLRRDYPQYYNEIVREINRCFRWNRGGRWRTVIRFEIQSDGRIPDSSIRIYTPSSNAAFDIEAFGAVACAGAGRLGPLPADLPFDALPVQFTFQPM